MPIYSKFKVKMMGETAILIEVADEISREANSYVLALKKKLEEKMEKLKGIWELVPAYTTLLVNYDPKMISVENLIGLINEIEDELKSEVVEEVIGKRRIIEIPVAYGGEFGPDLEFIAEYSGLSIEEVIKIHSSQTYLVYMIGFTPGFTYMGEVPDIIAVPRLEKPRLRVPAGSVGIAGKQTGIYPIESPGGWRIIGRTPLKLFDPTSPKPTLLNAGDLVKFKPISKEEYEKLKRKEYIERKEVITGEIALQILNAGPGVTIQDLGRKGYRKYGVPFSGALDKKSFMIANILVGNNVNSACIEVFQSSLTLKALREIIIAITGAEVYATVNGEKIPTYQATKLRKNDELIIQQFEKGQVAYIAIAGGIEEPTLLGSKSHYLKAGMGRTLKNGTFMSIGKIRDKNILKDYPARKAPNKLRTAIKKEIKLRIILGPHDDHFPNEIIEDFFDSTFVVTPYIDRMGFRLTKLKGESYGGTGRLISCGTMPGAIQIPPDGNPIVLMADAQTTGGYPIIGTVILNDLDILAQAQPGTKVKFEEISLDRSVNEYLNTLKSIEEFEAVIKNKVKQFTKKFEYIQVKYYDKVMDAWMSKH
ncbi:MAG: 5-oxoprolinase subunit PxpB [archaeon GB-1867-035]|nr:5-oxoprolinase subunit PxpB [Candidatus Culexmicrobium profundum]